MKTSSFSGMKWTLAAALFIGLFFCTGKAEAQAVYVAAPQVVAPPVVVPVGYYGVPRPVWGYGPGYYRPAYYRGWAARPGVYYRGGWGRGWRR